jgi:hypothetical protein
MAELSFDLRAMRAAVPIAQRETLGAELDSERLERVAQVIFRETQSRYRVNANSRRSLQRQSTGGNEGTPSPSLVARGPRAQSHVGAPARNGRSHPARS